MKKTFLLTFILVFILFLGIQQFDKKNKEPKRSIDFKTFIDAVKDKRVDWVTFDFNNKIHGQIKDSMSGRPFDFDTTGDTHSEVYQKILLENNIIPNFKEQEQPSLFTSLLINWLPFLFVLIIGSWVAMRMQNKNAKNPLNFSKSNDVEINDSKILFKDVAGVDEAKEELKDIVDFLKNPKKFTSMGARLPKGIMLVGSPGCGKTLLAKALAGEAGVQFLSVSGSHFVEMFVGVGASRVRNLFEKARKMAPCIVFIDEIDSVGKSRGSGSAQGGNDEREQTLNQLLVEMDGFEPNSGIIVVGATNRLDTLDPAILRPGRFDRKVNVPLPDKKGREDILSTHIKLKNIPLSIKITVDDVAKTTTGFSGADLENLLNEAALIAAKNNRGMVTLACIEQAKDKILMGSERKTLVVSQEDKLHTAYHEAGHTIIAKILPGLDKVHKVSIVPRGNSLGVTQTVADKDQLNISRDRAEKLICMLMGGRAAEEIKFDHITTGAGNDIERATNIAKKMVYQWGMSDSFGPMNFGNLLDNNSGLTSNYSAETLLILENEVANIIKRNYDRAVSILKEHKDKLEKISLSLIEKETLLSEDIEKFFKT